MERPTPAKRLPPLNALRTFEVAGRLQSIRGAAAELVVTPGAVSRQVRVLESWLGVPLFEHDARSVRLTEAGGRYLAVVTEHLSAIALATDQLTGRRGESTLHLRAYTLFATNWLVPRLTRFHRGQPWVELELTTSSRPEDFGMRDVDAEIRTAPLVRHSGRGDGPGSAAEQFAGFAADLLVSEELVVVCSPGYRAEHRLAKPQDLHRLRPEELLRSIASPDLWRRWLDAAGVTGLDPDRGPSYSDSVLTSQAAAAGQGVGLAPLALVDLELASGRLVTAFDSGPDLYVDFYLVHSPDQSSRRAFRAFRKWLLFEIAAAPGSTRN